jgi:catechol 2,3-dioxygenase-like lactoylglutathione lyase family enzyme
VDSVAKHCAAHTLDDAASAFARQRELEAIMKIVALTLVTPNLATQRSFYTTVLGLPLLHESAQRFTVQAGQTRLTFHTTMQDDIVYHFAFTIPRNQFVSAKHWLGDRVSLLSEGDADEFRSSYWPGYQTYFRDAANNILEFIAPDDLPIEAAGAFGSQQVLCISEVGMAVDDVLKQVTALEAQVGASRYQGSDTFYPVGDLDGRVIVVKTGRHWFPTTTAAVVAPFEVIMTGEKRRQYQPAGLPYLFRTAADERPAHSAEWN